MSRSPLPVAVVTGGSRGIGLATARAFLQGGFKVALCARHSERLAEAERALSPLGEIMGVVVDMRAADEIDHFIHMVMEQFGRIDVLVNNAGITWSGEFVTQPSTSIDAVIDVNVKGVLHATRAVLPIMIAAGDGVIVNIASGAGQIGFAELASYCASKFAVVGFTDSLAQEVARRGIAVYALCPGRVATDMQVEYSGKRVGIAPEIVAEKIFSLAQGRPVADRGRCLDVP